MSEAPETKEAPRAEVAVGVTVTPVLVEVYAYLEGEDVLFSHAWKEQGAAKRKKGKIEISQKDTPIHFHLTDRTGLDLVFCNPACDAMWVDLTDCPTGAGNGGQINYPSHPITKQLNVIDAKVGPSCTLHYALRFTGDTVGDGPPYEYYPEIKNV